MAQQKFADALGISREELTASLENMELQEKLGFKSEKSQKRLNDLMAQGMTKEQAIIQMKEEGAKGIEAAIQSDLEAQNAMKKLNLEKENVLIVEDSEKGYAAAVQSGANVIKVKNPSEVNIDLFKKIGII